MTEATSLEHVASPTVPIIGYHFLSSSERVRAFDDDELPYVLDARVFGEHLAGLQSAGRSSISLGEYTAGQELPPRPIVLTFDDGHASFTEIALELLAEYGRTATLFVLTDLIGRPDYLTRGQLQELSRQGIEIGSHGCSHRPLTAMPVAEMREELTRSKSILEDITGSPVLTLALPHGFGSRAVEDAAKEVGYQAICTSRFGLNSVPCTGFSLNRIGIKNSLSWEALGKLMQPGSMAYRKALLTDRAKSIGKWVLRTHKRCE